MRLNCYCFQHSFCSMFM
uniref:Uncharacterized protein n=1 Tax=Arundo donax TaxID=35708 RepID=A0A0A9FC03_ARUDO